TDPRTARGTKAPRRRSSPAGVRDRRLPGQGVIVQDVIVQYPAFRTLLYRYFFFSWLFKDASRGNVLERAAAWRHNREHAHWLLTYMRRWLWCSLVLYGLGGFGELVLHSSRPSRRLYLLGP